MNPKRLVVPVAAALLALASLAALSAAQDAGETRTAYVGGLETGKSAVPELIVFNTTPTPMTLDLVLRGPAGQELANLPGSLVLGSRQTLVTSLQEKLATAGTAGRPYAGLFSAEVTGAAPFAPDTVVVHVTQYFGSRKKPRAAFTIRPVFPAPAVP